MKKKSKVFYCPEHDCFRIIHEHFDENLRRYCFLIEYQYVTIECFKKGNEHVLDKRFFIGYL